MKPALHHTTKRDFPLDQKVCGYRQGLQRLHGEFQSRQQAAVLRKREL
jgi:hypothetical protein